MFNMNFLPKWYIEEKNLKKIKLIKIIVLITTVFNVLLFNVLIDKKNNIEDIKESIQVEKLKNHKTQENVVSYKGEKLKDLKLLFDNIPEEIKYRSLTIEGKNVNLELDSKDEQECLKLIDNLEKKEKLTVTNMCSLKDKGCFSITMKLID